MAVDPRGVHRLRGSVHLSTLLGAIDDQEGYWVHNRPWVAAAWTDALEVMAEAWFADDGENWLPALIAAPAWVERHLERIPAGERSLHEAAIADLLARARAQGILPADATAA